MRDFERTTCSVNDNKWRVPLGRVCNYINNDASLFRNNDKYSSSLLLLGTTRVRGASLNTRIPRRLLPSSLRIGKEQRE